MRLSAVHWGCLQRTSRSGINGHGDALGGGWRVHGGAGETRRGAVSKRVQGLPWRRARRRRILATADGRSLSVQLERIDAGRFVRTNSQNDAAKRTGQIEPAAKRGRARAGVGRKQIPCWKDGTFAADGVPERDSVRSSETGRKEIGQTLAFSDVTGQQDSSTEVDP